MSNLPDGCTACDVEQANQLETELERRIREWEEAQAKRREAEILDHAKRTMRCGIGLFVLAGMLAVMITCIHVDGCEIINFAVNELNAAYKKFGCIYWNKTLATNNI